MADDFEGLAELARRRRDESRRSPGGGGDGPGAFTPSGSAGSDEPKPIGGMRPDYKVPVPRSPESFRGMSANAIEGWSAQGSGPGSVRDQGVRYFDGDEWRPASLGPAGVGSLQEMMAAAGILTDDFRYGVWDEASRNAYKNVLAEANGMGLTADQIIRLRGQSATMPGAGGSGSGSGGGGSWQFDENGNPVFVPEQYQAPPLELRTSNKDDLRRVFREAIIEQMGEGWSKAQIDELVDAYNWEEIRVQKDAYDQAIAMDRAQFEGTAPAGGGGVVSSVEVASPETFLENQLMERDPEGFRAGQVVNEAIPNFLAALDGWV